MAALQQQADDVAIQHREFAVALNDRSDANPLSGKKSWAMMLYHNPKLGRRFTQLLDDDLPREYTS
jgi:hypothetical protein